MAGALTTREPDNVNFLSPLGFRFTVRKLPHVVWFVQEVVIPSLSLGEAVQPNPFGYAYQPGDKITYDPLRISFKVDEDMITWTELHEWMVGIGAPESYEQYATNLRRGGDAIISDATLIILNSVKNPKFEITFKDLFPTSLGELRFNSTDSDVNYLTVDATFRYLNFTYRRIFS